MAYIHHHSVIHDVNTTMSVLSSSNATENYGAAPPQIPTWFRLMVFSAYILALCVGGIGNALVCYVLVTRKQRKRSIHLLTLNLAFSDLIVSVIYLPTQMYLIQRNFSWELGDVTCRVVYGVNSCTISASIGTLLVITYDRYNAVTKPMMIHRGNTTRTKILIAMVWLISFTVTVPLLLVAQVHDGFCSELWPSPNLEHIYWIIVFIVQLALPLVYISVTYAVIIYSVKSSQTQFELVKLHESLKRNIVQNDELNNNEEVCEMRRKLSSKRTTAKNRRLSTSRSSNNRGRLKRKRQQNKLLKMSVVLVITYGVCVAPQHVVFFAATYGTLAVKPYAAFIFILSNLLMSINSALNPCIYGTLNDEMKKSIVRMLTPDTQGNRLSRNFRGFIDSMRLTIRRRLKFSNQELSHQESLTTRFQSPQISRC